MPNFLGCRFFIPRPSPLHANNEKRFRYAANGQRNPFVAEADDRPLSKGERLLVDVHMVFGDREGMASTELLRGLHDLETGTWSEYGRSRMPLDGKALARMLSAFDILTGQTIRVNGGEPVKGYRRTYFIDAWERYTPHLLTTPGHDSAAV